MNVITYTTTTERACCSSCAELSHRDTPAIACTLDEAEDDNVPVKEPFALNAPEQAGETI